VAVEEAAHRDELLRAVSAFQAEEISNVTVGFDIRDAGMCAVDQSSTFNVVAGMKFLLLRLYTVKS